MVGGWKDPWKLCASLQWIMGHLLYDSGTLNYGILKMYDRSTMVNDRNGSPGKKYAHGYKVFLINVNMSMCKTVIYYTGNFLIMNQQKLSDIYDIKFNTRRNHRDIKFNIRIAYEKKIRPLF